MCTGTGNEVNQAFDAFYSSQSGQEFCITSVPQHTGRESVLHPTHSNPQLISTLSKSSQLADFFLSCAVEHKNSAKEKYSLRIIKHFHAAGSSDLLPRGSTKGEGEDLRGNLSRKGARLKSEGWKFLLKYERKLIDYLSLAVWRFTFL